MKKTNIFMPVFILFCIFMFPAGLMAGELTFAWDANPESNLAGYMLWYGPKSREYQSRVDVGNVTTYTLRNTPVGVKRYYALTAYDFKGNESDYSIEVPFMIPAPTPPGPPTQFRIEIKDGEVKIFVEE